MKAVVAQSFERIHRSQPRRHGRAAAAIQGRHHRRRRSKLDGTETFDIIGLTGELRPRQKATLVVHRANGVTENVPVIVRIDTPIEVDYYESGGILPFVLRQLVGVTAA